MLKGLSPKSCKKTNLSHASTNTFALNITLAGFYLVLNWLRLSGHLFLSYLCYIALAITFALYHTCYILSFPELAALVFSFLLHHQNALAKLSQLLSHRQQSFHAKSIRSLGLLLAGHFIKFGAPSKISLSLGQIGHWVKV